MADGSPLKILSPSAWDPGNKEKLFQRERVIGSGGTSTVTAYMAEDGERVVVKASYCGQPNAMEVGSKEVATALDVVEMRRKTEPGSSAQAAHGGDDPFILRRPLSFKYERPCFYSVYPYVQSNLAQWLGEHPKRDAGLIKDFFLQILSILRSLRTRNYYYTDIKPTNFLVGHDSAGCNPRILIGDLGGLVVRGSARISTSPGRLPEDIKGQLSWSSMDVALSVLLGELLLQMLLKTRPQEEEAPATDVPGGDALAPLDDFLACVRERERGKKRSSSSRRPCHTELLGAAKRELAAGIEIEDPLSLDLLCIALLLMGFGDRKMCWQDVPSLHSPINSRATSR